MKRHIRFSTIAFTILALLLATFPASAAEKFPITGTCILIAFPPYIGDIEQSPDYRYWEPAGKEHWRNQVLLFTCDFNDDRLDGYFYMLDNWNINPNENSNFYSRETGKGYMSDENGNDLGLWDAVKGVGGTESTGNWEVVSGFQGRGMYQGLKAKLTWSSDIFPVYYLEGELLVP
jgi:hypothetical protein